MVRVGEPVPNDLASAKVIDEVGREVALAEFWQDTPHGPD